MQLMLRFKWKINLYLVKSLVRNAYKHRQTVHNIYSE